MDMHTLGTVLAVTAVCLLLVLVLLYQQNRQYAGLGWWTLGQGFMVVTFLIAGSATAQTWMPMLLVSTSCTVAALVCMYVGIVRFLGRPVPRWPWFYLAGATVLLAYLVFGHAEVGLRRAVVYFLLAGVQALTFRALVVHRRPYMATSGRFLRIVFALAVPYYTVLGIACLVSLRPGERTLDVSAVPAFAFTGAVMLMVMWTFGLSLLVSEHLRYDLADDRENLRQIFLAGPDSTLITRLADGLILDVNEGFTRVSGYPREEVIGRTTLDVGLWADPEQRRLLLESLADGPVDEMPATMRTRSGENVDVALSARVITLGQVPYVITVEHDMSAHKRREDELRRQATTDDLTGMLNRRAFLTLAAEQVRQCRLTGRPLAVAVIDLDEFKQLNDTLGHAAGDAALCSFAQGASAVLRQGDAIGRLGGDEFAVLLPATDLAGAQALVERLRNSLGAQPLRLVDGRVQLTFSAGVATYEGCNTVDDLFAKADGGLYRAKALGRNQVVAA